VSRADRYLRRHYPDQVYGRRRRSRPLSPVSSELPLRFEC